MRIQALLVSLLSASLFASAHAQQERDTKAAITSFRGLHKKEQSKVLAAMRQAVAAVDEAYLRGVRAASLRAQQGLPRKGKKRAKAIPHKSNWKEAVGGDHALTEGLAFPVHNQYLFGQGKIVVFEARAEKHKKGEKKKKRKKRSSKFPRAASPEEQVESMLHGYLPELDLALSSLLRQLDTDRRADVFSVFLESWRNGNESFYRALDRTAGTKSSLFFYDAMLSGYIRLLVPKKHKDFKKIRRSSKVAHDALHSSFLAYRQYRGMRESLALVLLLPPDADLPGALSRYEKKSHENYSFRDEATLMLRVCGQDISKVVDILLENAEPLPDHLWEKPYDPWLKFNKAFDDMVPEMLKLGVSTDVVLTEQNSLRKATQKRVSDAAWGAFAGAMLEVQRH